MMTLAQLRYVVAVDTCRTFRKAAEACGVAQPSLSTQIHKLEQELGVRLIDRSTTPVTPTPAGERVIAQARIVLAEVAKIDVLVGRGPAEVGPVRIGMPAFLAMYLVPRLLPFLAEQYPDLEVAFVEVASNEMTARLQRDGLDIGLAEEPVAARGITASPLFDEALVVYASAGHALHTAAPLREEELRRGKRKKSERWDSDVWLPTTGRLRSRVLELLPKGGGAGEARIHVATPNLEMIKRLVEQGAGWTVLPRLAVEPPATFQQACVLPFADPVPKRTIYSIHAQAPLRPRRIGAFLDAVRQVMDAPLPDEERDK